MKVPQKIRNRITTCSSNSITEYLSKEFKIECQRGICKSTTHYSQEPKGECNLSLTDDYIQKMQNAHAMEYYAAFKKEEVLSKTTTWIILEDVMLSK